MSEAVLPGLPFTTEHPHTPFRPKPPANLDEAGLSPSQIESRILKILLNQGIASGRWIAEELGLPFGLFTDFLRQLKNQQIVAYTDATSANDFHSLLTETGRNRAMNYFNECSYIGTASVDGVLWSLKSRFGAEISAISSHCRATISDVTDEISVPLGNIGETRLFNELRTRPGAEGWVRRLRDGCIVGL